MKAKLNLCRFLGSALLALVFAVGAYAQGTSELSGVINDPTGAVVPNVEVKLTNAATGIVRTTGTSAAGIYRFAALPVVGTYTLTVDAKGFKKVVVGNIVPSVGTTITKDLRLEIGSAQETVDVEAGAQMVQTTESSVSQLLDNRVWQQMPMEVRDSNGFIDLVAGAVPDAFSGNTRGAAVNGTRGGSGNFLVDGMDNNDQGQAGRGQLDSYSAGGAITSISPEAIQEYRVVTNSFAPEYGKAGGFVTDTVLKSGTNQWHGSLFEYNRVQALAANGFFENREDIKKSLVRNQFGGSFGGPIKKDKTFFYGSLEFHRAREAGALSATSTTQQFLDFVNSGQMQSFLETSPNGFCNNQSFLNYNLGGPSLGKDAQGNDIPNPQYRAAAPCSGAFSGMKLGSIFQKLQKQGPFPLATGDFYNTGEGAYSSAGSAKFGAYTYNFAGITWPVPAYGTVFVQDPTHLNEYRISTKFDHKFSEKDQFSGMFLLQHAEQGSPYDGGYNTIGPAYTNDGVSENIGLTWNHTFSPTILNTAKISYLRHRSDFPAPAGTTGIPQINTFDDMSVGFGLYAGLPQYFTDNQFQYQESLSFVKGKHNFKTGVEYRRTRNGSRFFNDYYGTFYPWAVEDLVTDLTFTDLVDKQIFDGPAYGSAAQASAAVNPSTGKQPELYRGYRANELAAYFQDDWRISNRFTLNWGMRYEYFGPPHNFRQNIDSNVYFGVPTTPFKTTSTNPWMPVNSQFYASVATATFQVRNNEIWGKDTNNFGPRLGFSWDMLGNQKIVMRAGAGIMYDRIYNNIFENIRFNPPFYSDNQTGFVINGVPVGALATPGMYTVPFTSTGMFVGGGAKAPVPNPRHMDQNLVTPYYEQVHYGFQYEFAKGYVFEPEYVGTFGHKLMGFRDINTFDGRTVAGLGSTRPNPNIGADNFRSSDYNSNYHGLQMTVRKNYSNGLSFNSSFTWSKALDDMSDVFNARTYAHPVDNMNPGIDYGPADFNMGKRFVTSLSYDLPFAKNNRFLGGWGLNTIFSIQGGVPFSPYNSSSSYDLNKDGYYTDRVMPTNMGTSLDAFAGSNQTAVTYLSKANWYKYTCPASVNNGQWCNAPIGRNSMTGPGYWNVDLNLNKKFKINERAALTLQGNFFNLFNHTNFNLPNANFNSGTFGQITSVAGSGARVTQLALRFDF